MPVFRYTALDTAGRRVAGESQRDVGLRLGHQIPDRDDAEVAQDLRAKARSRLRM